jgi:hypothetical protein
VQATGWGAGKSGYASARNKSFFASFFSKKEESSFSEEKEAKRLSFLVRSSMEIDSLYGVGNELCLPVARC